MPDGKMDPFVAPGAPRELDYRSGAHVSSRHSVSGAKTPSEAIVVPRVTFMFYDDRPKVVLWVETAQM